MNNLTVKIKKLHEKAVIPTYAKEGDAGMDLTAVGYSFDEYGNHVYRTGLAFEIPKGYYMQLTPRSSNHKTDLYLTNHCGIVDSGYRGEVFFKFKEPVNIHKESLPIYEVGERIGQLVILPYPKVTFEEVSELAESERGTGGYGSSGK